MENKEQKDSLTSCVSKGIGYCKAHFKALGIIVVVIAVVWIATACYLSHKETVRQNSWAQYYQAQIALMTQSQEAATAEVEQLAAAYPDTDAAYYGRLMLADLLFTQENFAQAADIYKALLSAKNSHVRTIAAISLAGAQQAMQDYAASIATAQDFITHNPTSFALPQAPAGTRRPPLTPHTTARW